MEFWLEKAAEFEVRAALATLEWVREYWRMHAERARWMASQASQQ